MPDSAGGWLVTADRNRSSVPSPTACRSCCCPWVALTEGVHAGPRRAARVPVSDPRTCRPSGPDRLLLGAAGRPGVSQRRPPSPPAASPPTSPAPACRRGPRTHRPPSVTVAAAAQRPGWLGRHTISVEKQRYRPALLAGVRERVRLAGRRDARRRHDRYQTREAPLDRPYLTASVMQCLQRVDDRCNCG